MHLNLITDEHFRWEINIFQVFDIGKGANTPITGLEYFQLLASDKYVIFAATPSRLYYFSGTANAEEKPVLQQVFNKYLNVPEPETHIKCENTTTRYSKLQFWSENLITPNQFAWITEKGITFGQVSRFFHIKACWVPHWRSVTY